MSAGSTAQPTSVSTHNNDFSLPTPFRTNYQTTHCVRWSRAHSAGAIVQSPSSYATPASDWPRGVKIWARQMHVEPSVITSSYIKMISGPRRLPFDIRASWKNGEKDIKQQLLQPHEQLSIINQFTEAPSTPPLSTKLHRSTNQPTCLNSSERL